MRRVVAVLAVAACGHHAGVGTVRFANQQPAAIVDDRLDVARPPEKTPYHRYSLHVDSYYLRTMRGLNLEKHRRAQGVNALDDVPDSTWFTNRIGKRTVTPDEIRRGPGPESPDLHLPWTITRLKSGGTAPGFVAKDSAGVTFMLKFDPPNGYEMETGADVITARLVWALGYNTPSDHVVYFRRSDLKIAPDATRGDGAKRAKLDRAVVDATLAKIPMERDGRIRGIASVLVEGTALGGTARLGTRAGDPNDRIPHELRRDLRGRAAIAAWLADDDLREDNSLDTYVADPANPDVHYVLHYALDFGSSLGADALFADEPYTNFEYGIDFLQMLRSTVTLGLLKRDWEDLQPVGIRGIGLYEAAHYDPGAWKPNSPAAFPVLWADRFDKFWGSKLLIRFSREQLAAAVDAARFSDPRAKPYIVDALVARQRKTAWYWFRRVNPIDELAIDDGRLCFTDLALRYRLETAATRFTITPYDRTGKRVGDRVTATPDGAGRACAAAPLARDADGYTILLVTTSRGIPGTQVHVANDPVSGELRVIGIHRL